MRRRLVYSVTLASVMLGGCEIVGAHDDKPVTPVPVTKSGLASYADGLSDPGLGGIEQIQPASSGRRLAAPVGGTQNVLADLDPRPLSEQGVTQSPGTPLVRQYGCLTDKEISEFSGMLEGLFAPDPPGCEFVAVVLKDQKETSVETYYPILEGLQAGTPPGIPEVQPEGAPPGLTVEGLPEGSIVEFLPGLGLVD